MNKPNDFDFENIEDFAKYEAPNVYQTAEDLNEDEELFDDNDDIIYNSQPVNYDDITDSLSDIDFSEIRGDFKTGMKSIVKKVEQKKRTNGGRAIAKKGRKIKNVPVKSKAIMRGPTEKKIGKVIVPRDRKVIIEGISKFMLDDTSEASEAKSIGYYKGKKLNELVFIINNTGALPFTIELFNPSFPLDYLYSTGLNINDKISVSGQNPTQYTDVLSNILANPTFIPNAKFVVSGPLLNDQVNQSLTFTNKNIEGKAKINPYNIFLQKDIMQFQNQIIYFDIMKGLNRPFIPDGMDVVTYTILPGMIVTFGFYYKQVSLKKFFYEEARHPNSLLL